METELLKCLVALTLASTVSICAVLAMRYVVRLLFGAAAAYATWLLVPVAMLGVLLPNPRDSALTIGVALPVDSGSALRHALDSSPGSLLLIAPSIDWTQWALVIWLVGASLFLIYLAALQRAFVRSLGSLSGSQCVLRAARRSGCPAVLGILRPKVVLPADFESRYTRLERLLIFSHERTHLRRGDAIWNGLVALTRCVLWFNPLVHLASSIIRQDQELACDAAVADDHPGSRASYAAALLKTQLADTALPIGCHWHAARHLKMRLRMLKKSAPIRSRRGLGYAIVAVAALLSAYGAWASTLSVASAGEPDVPSRHASSRARNHEMMTYSQFYAEMQNGKIESVMLGDTALPVGSAESGTIYGVLKDKTTFETYNSKINLPGLIGALLKANVSVMRTAVPSAATSTELRGRDLKMMLGPHWGLQVLADRSWKAQSGAGVWDGHVRMEISYLRTGRITRGRVTSAEWRHATIRGAKVVITPESSGGFKVEIQNGLIRLS